MKKILTQIFLLSLFVSCNQQMKGSIVDQSLSTKTSESQIVLSDVEIKKEGRGYLIDIKYVDAQNTYKNERAIVRMPENKSLTYSRESFTSFGLLYSGDIECLNWDCSNADFSINFKDTPRSSNLKMAKREYSINVSSITFAPLSDQNNSGILAQAKAAQKSMDQYLNLSLIQIEGINSPLISLNATSKAINDTSVNLTLESTGVKAPVLVGSSGNFNISHYSNDEFGNIYMVLRNHSGDIVIDHKR